MFAATKKFTKANSNNGIFLGTILGSCSHSGDDGDTTLISASAASTGQQELESGDGGEESDLVALSRGLCQECGGAARCK
jgi:hypothetical protein